MDQEMIWAFTKKTNQVRRITVNEAVAILASALPANEFPNRIAIVFALSQTMLQTETMAFASTTSEFKPLIQAA